MSSPQWMKKRQVRLRLTESAIERLDWVASVAHCSRSVAADALIRADSDAEAVKTAMNVSTGDATALMAGNRGGNGTE